MNLDINDNLWFYYYTDFDLVKTDYKNFRIFTPSIKMAYNFMIARNEISFLFSGGYKNSKFYKIKLIGLKMTQAKECEFKFNNKHIYIDRFYFRKSFAVIIDKSGDMYITDWIG